MTFQEFFILTTAAATGCILLILLERRNNKQIMKLNLTYPAAKLLKFTLSSTGEKEPNEQGQEVNSPRKLDGKESSQRRHYAKAIETFEKQTEDQIKQLQDAHNNLVEEERAKLEPKDLTKEAQDKVLNTLTSLQDSVKNVQEKVIELLNKKEDIEVTNETKEVITKYFKEYGDKVGFVEADDQVVQELEEVLK